MIFRESSTAVHISPTVISLAYTLAVFVLFNISFKVPPYAPTLSFFQFQTAHYESEDSKLKEEKKDKRDR